MILESDIKIYESDNMTDADEGGGLLTGVEIISGDSNGIFPDLSDVDTTHGSVKLRKIFGNIKTQTTNEYRGAHVIISKLPKNKRLTPTLFNTGSWFDRRPVAKNRIENYLAKGGKYIGALWATQFKDSKVINIYQNPSAPLPEIGDVLFLTSVAKTQPIRIISVDSSLQVFTDNEGDFTRLIVSVGISDGLDNDFVGLDISRTDTAVPPTVIFRSVVADAATYYGSKGIAEPITAGDLTIKVDSIFNQLVPSSESPTALIDVEVAAKNEVLVDSAHSTAGIVSILYSATMEIGDTIICASSIAKNSF